jgi:HSP20 family protein
MTMGSSKKKAGKSSKSIPTMKVDSIIHRIEQTQNEVLSRAYEIFRDRERWFESALDDWLTAERELVWRPAIELSEKDAVFTLDVDVAGVAPKELDVQVTPNSVLIESKVSYDYKKGKGTVHTCEFRAGKLFRSVEFPEPVDPDRVKAECRKGLLRITAPVAAGTRGKRVPVGT